MSDRDGLTSRYLAGIATPAEHAELLRELQDNPGSLTQFRDELRMHLALAAYLQPADAGVVAASVVRVPQGPTPSGLQRIRGHVKPPVRKRAKAARLANTHNRRPWWWLSLTVAACVLVGMYVSVRPAVTCGHIVSVVGSIQLRRNGEAISSTIGTQLRPGDRLACTSTGTVIWQDDAGAELTLTDGAVTCVAMPKRVTTVHSGTFHAEVVPRAAGDSPYAISTPTCDVVVLGTAFTLTVQALQTDLLVEHGRVQLSRTGTAEQTIVGAGEHALATPTSLTVVGPVVHEQPMTAFRLSQDQEKSPRNLAWGQVAPTPDQADGWCLQGVTVEKNLEIYLANSDSSAELFTVPNQGVLSFRYFASEGGNLLSAFALNGTTGKSVSVAITATTFGRWTTVQIPLSQFVVEGFQDPGFRPGDQVKNLIISADPPERNRIFLIDDILVTGLTKTMVPSVSAARP